MDIEQRIAQFTKMATDDPENDMAHYSLGGALAEAGRHAEAAESYLRATQLNPSFSKAYQLAGRSLIEGGDKPRAAEVLREGYAVAAERGDLMPKKAIGELLESIGEPLPAVQEKAAAPIPEGAFICQVTSKPGTEMDRPPFKGPVGKWIVANVSRETWNEWIGQGTKVINELRLDLSRDEDAETYDRHMREFLGIDDALLAKLRGGTG
ncbi:MAG: tetratricopeptide repeat protein [Phycisphaerales bacterium]|nr:MAG: tetratricopeptide repeat protein [Phycisphaerales bacterium]